MRRAPATAARNAKWWRRLSHSHTRDSAYTYTQGLTYTLACGSQLLGIDFPAASRSMHSLLSFSLTLPPQILFYALNIRADKHTCCRRTLFFCFYARTTDYATHSLTTITRTVGHSQSPFLLFFFPSFHCCMLVQRRTSFVFFFYSHDVLRSLCLLRKASTILAVVFLPYKEEP